MANVYRFEDGHGTGVYRCRDSFGFFNHLTPFQRCEKHPTPTSDFLLKKEWDRAGSSATLFHFGFASLGQALEWFDLESILCLNNSNWGQPDKLALKFVVYKTPSVVYGERQAMFKKHEATLIKEISLRTLINLLQKKLLTAPV